MVSLKEARNLLYDVRLKWYDIGVELNVDEKKLDEIKFKNKEDPGVCLREMLRVCLENTLTWRAIAEALEAKAISELRLASEAKARAVTSSSTVFKDSKRTSVTAQAHTQILTPAESNINSKVTSALGHAPPESNKLNGTSGLATPTEFNIDIDTKRNSVLATKIRTSAPADSNTKLKRSSKSSSSLCGPADIPQADSVSHEGEPEWKLRTGIVKSVTNIRNHPSYIGPKNGKQAEHKLKQRGGNCYLLRHSEAHKRFKISVLSTEGNDTLFQHFKIRITTNEDQREYEIEGTTKKFDDISELLVYYEKNPVNSEISSIGTALRKMEDSQKKDGCCTML